MLSDLALSVAFTCILCHMMGIPIAHISLTKLRTAEHQGVLLSLTCGNLPQCKTDNSHRVAKIGDIYTLQIVAWP
jgi:hypothetical protein